MSDVIADASVLVALLVRGDQHHGWASEQAQRLPFPLFTCEAALAEAAHLLRRAGAEADVLVEWIGRGLLHVPFALEPESGAVKALMRGYRDLPMSLADACLVRMAELREGARVWTTDSHFRIYRLHGRKEIELIAPF